MIIVLAPNLLQQSVLCVCMYVFCMFGQLIVALTLVI